MKSWRLIVILLACLAMAGCGNFFAPDRNVKEPLSEKDVLGTWALSTNTLRLLARDGIRPPSPDPLKIEFAPDGRCLLQTILDFDPKHRFISATGRWSLEHDTQGDSNVRKKNAIHIEVNSASESRQIWLNFARENGVLLLWNYYSDPDLWEFIEYRRAAGSAPSTRR